MLTVRLRCLLMIGQSQRRADHRRESAHRHSCLRYLPSTSLAPLMLALAYQPDTIQRHYITDTKQLQCFYVVNVVSHIWGFIEDIHT